MKNSILGLHHITAIAGNAKTNLDFYTHILGQRLVKKTVNFDDPRTYHFYFGNEAGEPGTLLTFFPWEGIGKGSHGSGMATHIAYAVPPGALRFWKKRLNTFSIPYEESEIFGEACLSFSDPDGLQLQFIESAANDHRRVWATADVAQDVALKGFHTATLTLGNAAATARVLTDLLGYEFHKEEDNRLRFGTGSIETAQWIDLLEEPFRARGKNATGTNHHVAFRVKDDTILMDFREKIAAAGFNITQKINRDYFFSLYFREPGGVLFEIATDNPGFTVDEPLTELGTHLMLPERYKTMRSRMESGLPKLD